MPAGFAKDGCFNRLIRRQQPDLEKSNSNQCPSWYFWVECQNPGSLGEPGKGVIRHKKPLKCLRTSSICMDKDGASLPVSRYDRRAGRQRDSHSGS